jgi:hypothetical protein
VLAALLTISISLAVWCLLEGLGIHPWSLHRTLFGSQRTWNHRRHSRGRR